MAPSAPLPPPLNYPFTSPTSRSPPVIDELRLEYDFSDPKSRIGVGTYGAVYVGRYYGSLVAIKRVIVPQSSSPTSNPAAHRRRDDAIRQFAREIRRYEQISHPGIVGFLGVTLPADSSALLVTQLMHGGSLGDALTALRAANIPFHRPSVFTIAQQASSGLSALHAHDCTWGDAKPENILLSEPLDNSGQFPSDAEAKIADFGLSRSVGQCLLAETTLAGTGEIAGTYNYMAPESLISSNCDNPQLAKAADVYAFGLVIYEMLTLRTPWKGRSLTAVYESVRSGERPKWPEPTDDDYHPSPIPEDMRNLVERCWHPSADKRPSSEKLCAELSACRDAFSDTNGERRVSDITSGTPSGHDFTSGSFVRALSKHSSASTAVPVDGSVDMSSTAESIRDSRLGNTNGDGHSIFNSLSPRHIPGPSDARVSPVTSPDVRSSKNIPDVRVPDLEQPVIGGQTGANEAGPSYGIPPRSSSSARLVGGGGSLGPYETLHLLGKSGVMDDEDITGSVADPRPSGGSSLNRQQFSGGHNQSHSAAVKQPQTPTKKLLDAESTSAARMPRQRSRQHDLLLNTTVDGTVADLTNSNGSSLSLHHLRSKRLQSIIEHATKAFLEENRRQEMASKMPPRLRREAADRRAAEESRKLQEAEALQTMERARVRYDFSTVLRVMKSHQDLLAVVKAGCNILEEFCSKKNIFSDLCDEGAVEELLSAATLFGKTDVGLSLAFCRSVTALSLHYDDRTGHLIRADGVPSMVIEVMEYHKNEVSVQVAGSDCLASIAGASELSRSAVATLGGPRAVYIAMTRNNASFKDVPLARSTLNAVRQIAQDNELAAEFLVQVSALDCVSKSAEVFTDDGLEVNILASLRSFAFYNGGRRNIILSSGLRALTAIMLRNRDPDFLVQCCTFIRSIARWRDVECEKAMLESCIAERITTLMQDSNDIPGEEGARVAWYSCHACTFLASFGSRSRQRLRRVHAIETAILVLNHRISNVRVVHSATDALAELVKGEPESRLHAEKQNAIPSLQEALRRHSSVLRVRKALQWTIDYLSSTSGTNPNPGPALGSKVYQELMKEESNGQPAQSNASRRRGFLGFKWNR